MSSTIIAILALTAVIADAFVSVVPRHPTKSTILSQTSLFAKGRCGILSCYHIAWFVYNLNEFLSNTFEL